MLSERGDVYGRIHLNSVTGTWDGHAGESSRRSRDLRWTTLCRRTGSVGAIMPFLLWAEDPCGHGGTSVTIMCPCGKRRCHGPVNLGKQLMYMFSVLALLRMDECWHYVTTSKICSLVLNYTKGAVHESHFLHSTQAPYSYHCHSSPTLQSCPQRACWRSAR